MTDNRSWALPRQNQLLSSHIGKFKEHQAAGTLALKFWPKLDRKFFTLWKSQKRERREWEMLREMVEGGKIAMPACLGGGSDAAAKEAGLDIVAPEKKRKGDGEDDGEDEEDRSSEDEVSQGGKDLSDLSSDDEDVRAANEAALTGAGSNPTPDGADGNAAPKAKSKKKKKPSVINVPAPFTSNKEWKKKRTQQSHRWFYNATSKSRAVGPKVNIDFKGLFSNALSARALTEPQMYSRLFYEKKVKKEVDEEAAKKNLTKGERLTLMGIKLQEAYDNEPESVKEMVREEMVKAAQEKDEAMQLLKEMSESGGEKAQTPEEYAKIQNALGAIIRSFFDVLGPMSGYAFMVIGGGPKADNLNGSMGYVSYNRGWGESRNDFTFNRWYDEYHENLVTPFGNYCHEVFPEETRLQHAIIVGDAPNLSLDALKKSGRNFGKLQNGGEIAIDKVNLAGTGGTSTRKEIQALSARRSTSTKDTKKAMGSKEGHGEKVKGKRKRRKAFTRPDSDGGITDPEHSDDPSDPSDHERRKARKKNRKPKTTRDDNESESEDADDESDAAPKGKRAARGRKAEESGDSETDTANRREASREGGGGREAESSSGSDDEDDIPSRKRAGKRGRAAKAIVVEDESDSDEETECEGGTASKSRNGAPKLKDARGKAKADGKAGKSQKGRAMSVPKEGMASALVPKKGKASGSGAQKKAITSKRDDNGVAGSDNSEQPAGGEIEGDEGVAKKPEVKKGGKGAAKATPDGTMEETLQEQGEKSNEEAAMEALESTPPPRNNNDAHLHDNQLSNSGSPRLPQLPSPPEDTRKRKPESTSLDTGGRSKRIRRQTRIVEEWVVETKAFLLRQVKGTRWEELVEAWYEFETTGFDKPLRITEVSSRPHELKKWLAGRRSSMPGPFGPLLDDVNDYKEHWMAWWGDLTEGGVEASRPMVRRAGPQGVVTILLGLAFWSEGKGRVAEWKKVVGEFRAILKAE